MYSELAKLKVKGTVSTSLPSLQTPPPSLGAPRIIFSSEQLAVSSGVPMTIPRVDNLLEQFMEFREVLYLEAEFYYNKNKQTRIKDTTNQQDGT